MDTTTYSDAELVSRSLAGDRDAFGGIVSRYQNLICSLAYSRIGNFGQSEDVAQETFITAWKHLRLLREPEKLRGWLCGIVRNRIHKYHRREGRQPVHDAETLERLTDSPNGELLPSDHAASREEEAILWRSLAKIPEMYRDPLVLFYREQHSIEAVAEKLDLSADAVKQRLSRGRKLLQEDVHAVVEAALRRTAPSPAFPGIVIAALPASPGIPAGVIAAGHKAAAAKSSWLGCWFAPLVGIVGGLTAHWLVMRAAPSARERRFKKPVLLGFWLFVLAWCIPGTQAMRVLSERMVWDDATYFRAMAGFWWCYALVLSTIGILTFRRVEMIRHSEQLGAPQTAASRPLGPGAGIVLVAGVHLAYFWWLIGLAWKAQDPVSATVIAGVMVALAVRSAVQLRHISGVAAIRAVAGHQALVWVVILLILNGRLSVWVAFLTHLGLAETHRLMPVWVVPLLTLALVVWAWLLLRVSKRLLLIQAPSA